MRTLLTIMGDEIRSARKMDGRLHHLAQSQVRSGYCSSRDRAGKGERKGDGAEEASRCTTRGLFLPPTRMPNALPTEKRSLETVSLLQNSRVGPVAAVDGLGSGSVFQLPPSKQAARTDHFSTALAYESIKKMSNSTWPYWFLYNR